MAQTRLAGCGCEDGDDDRDRVVGLLKFSGQASTAGISFLADGGPGTPVTSAPSYPVARRKLRLKNLAVNLLGFTPPSGVSLTVQLLKNGSPVSGFSVTYEAGDTGVLSTKTKRVKLSRDDTFDLQVSLAGIGVLPRFVNLSATIEEVARR